MSTVTIAREWRDYLASVDVNDARTPRERLAEYFSKWVES